MASPAPAAPGDAEQAEMQQHEAAIFAKLGGWTSIQLAVNLFYEKVLGDPLLAPYFEGISMDRLRKKQIMFMSFAFGGVSEFYGQQIAYAHRDMILKQGLNLTHYDAVAGHFVATLTELGVPGPLIAEAAGVVLTTRPYFDPQAVFAEVESFKAQVAAPVASTLRALQQELRSQGGGSTASKPTSPSPAPSAATAAPVVPPGEAGAQGDLGGAEEAGQQRASCPASAQGSMERLRISTLAEVFSSQVLGEGHARAFAAAARSGTSSRADSRLGLPLGSTPGREAGASTSGAAAPSPSQPLHQGITSSELLSALADGSSADLTSTEAASRAPTSTLSQAPSGSVGQQPGLSPAELEAKRLRRKMMKDILRGIGVLPGSGGAAGDPTSTTAPVSAPLPARAAAPGADGAPAPAAAPNPAAPTKADMMTVYRAASNSSPAGEERFSRGSNTGDLSSLPSNGQLTPPASGGAGSDAGEGEGRQRLQQQLERLSKSSGKLTPPGGASATVVAAATAVPAPPPAYTGQGPPSEDGSSSSSSSSSGVSFVDESDHETPHEEEEDEDAEEPTSPPPQPRLGGAYGSPSAQQRVARRQGSKLELRTGSVHALDPVDELPEASTAAH